jgi:hypothetical protein
VTNIFEIRAFASLQEYRQSQQLLEVKENKELGNIDLQ